MPTYDFRCPSCEARFEVQRSIADFDQPTSCPEGHEGAVRVITSWGVTGGVRYGSPAAAGRRGKTGVTVQKTEAKPATPSPPA
ncbi:MAG: zinc ribbon domain-containing protein [Acidimicrobiales bacterium]